MNMLTQASNSYMNTFHNYVGQFMEWGQWIFFSLVTINIVWLCLWYAFDRHSLVDSLSDFIKKFFMIAIFYTIMMNSTWLMDVLKTTQSMGNVLTNVPIDPSSLISQGIALGNKIVKPIEESSLLTAGFSLIILAISYLIILFVFISIALDLSVTLITTTALISVASFFLGFSALGATSNIARQTLDSILANCIKLLGIYLVVASGSQTISIISDSIPTTIDQLKQSGLDFYAWITAGSILFWLISKNLPMHLARIVTNAIQENSGVSPAALGVSALNIAKSAIPAIHAASNIGSSVAKLAGSTGYNAASHFNHGIETSGQIAVGAGAAVGGSMIHLGQSVAGNLSDHFKHISNKLSGGPGLQQPIQGVAERMYQSANQLKSKSSTSSSDKHSDRKVTP